MPVMIFAQIDEKAKTKPVQAGQKEALHITRPTVEYTSMGLKDPFRLFKPVKEIKKMDIVEIPVNPPELRVSGLVWGAETPQAIINGKVVKVGDIIENARIDSIGKSGVVIEFSGKKFTLSVTTNISSKTNNRNTQGSPIGVPIGNPQGGRNAR
jgi:type II secretory pathway component PulC